MRYLLPFITFMVLTELQRFAGEESIFWIYGFKTAATLVVIYLCFKDYRDEISGSFDLKAVFLGLAVLFIWIVLGQSAGRQSTASFNPEVFNGSSFKYLAIFFRVTGACLVVPIMEELIWRSFLMRYLIDQNFLKVPLGKYTHLSFWGTVIAFTLVHQSWEWPATAVTGILYGLYLVKTKNLIGCIWAHAVTNAGLAVYVLMTGQWFWW